MIVINTLLFAGAAFAISFAVIASAFMLVRGRAAAVRHLIWTGAFTVLLLLPAAMLVPSQVTWLLPAAPVVETVDVPAVAAAPAAAPAPKTPIIDAADIVFGLAGLWAAGLLFHLFRLAAGGIGLVFLYRRSVAHIPAGIDPAPFRGLSWQLRLRTVPGANDIGPLTFGVRRPVVLLPKASVTWSRERLTSVLLHEAAHVRRRDSLCRLIGLLAAALYWPNPFVWMALTAMRRDGENAADDAVINAGVKPTRYAEHLVGLAREFSGAGLAMTLSMAERRMLDARVEAILDPEQSRIGVTKMDVLKLGVASVALIAGFALVRPSLAETPAKTETHVTATTTKTATGKPKRHVVVKTITRGEDGSEKVTSRDFDVDGDGEFVMPEPPEPPRAPTADMAPPAPPAPPAAAAMITPPAPPAPPAPAMEMVVGPDHAMHDGDRTRHVTVTVNADARRAMADARRAIADAHIEETVRNAMKQAEQALRDAKLSDAQAKKALAHMDIDRVVAQAMKKAEIALKKAEIAQTRATQHVVVKHRIINDKGETVIDDENDTDGDTDNDKE